MQRVSWRNRVHQEKLLEHYRKNMAVAIEAAKTEGLLPEEFCWMVLSWQTAQLVADIGRDEAAAMFDAWAALTKQGLFGDFDGTELSKFEDFVGSVIY